MIWIWGGAMALASGFFPGTDDEWLEVRPAGDMLIVGANHRVRLTRHVLVRLEGTAAEGVLEHDDVLGRRRLMGAGSIWQLHLRADADPLGFSANLHSLPGVVWSHPDFEIALHPTGPLDDTYWDTLWHLENTARYPNQVADADVDAPEAWEIADGSGTIIAIIDTGVDLVHEDLDVLPGYDFVDDDDNASPEMGTSSYAHGTAMAGIAAAVGNNAQGVAGVAHGAQILPIRLIGTALISDVYDSFVWATDQGADVLSNSWSLSALECDEVPLYALIKDGIDYAVENGRDGRGTAVVLGTGNVGCDISRDGLIAYEPVVGVGASSDRDEVFGYSNYGEHVDVVAPSGPGPGDDLDAFEYIRSTDITGSAGYPPLDSDAYTGTIWGTSASTPMVAATLALMFQANSRLDQADARAVLCETADPIDTESEEDGWSPYAGCGRVNTAAAVWAVVNDPPPAPTALAPSDGAQVASDAVVLQWSSVTDPDGDAVTYEIDVWPEDDPEATWTENVEEATSLDLSDTLPEGSTWSWRVWSVDVYGRGEEGTATGFSVAVEDSLDSGGEAPSPDDGSQPAEKKGCGCIATGMVGGWQWIWVALAVAHRRRPS